MQIAVSSFTRNGKELADKIAGYLSEEGYEAVSYTHLDVYKRQ